MMDFKPYMKDFFEKYYNKIISDFSGTIRSSDIPKEMLVDDADPTQEYNSWKLVESTVTDEELNELEKKLGIKFPQIIRDFLSTYFHCFNTPIGKNSIKDPFRGIYHAWNPLLVESGYLPFTWDYDHYYILCIKLTDIDNYEKCGIYQIGYDKLFDIDYDPSYYKDTEDLDVDERVDLKDELADCILEVHKNMEFVNDNFKVFLDNLLLSSKKRS